MTSTLKSRTRAAALLALLGSALAAAQPAATPAVAPADASPAATPDKVKDIAELDLDQLLGTVISASLREQKANEAPVTVTSVAADDLEGTGLFSLCDALQFVPGVDCRHGPMRKAVISMRGLGSNFLSNRVLLLKDGRPETDPWTGIFYPDESNPVSNLKRVEIIRGPGSSMYGTNAFSGVINVLTRNPDDLIAKGRSFGADGKLLVGSDATVRGEVTAAGRVRDLSGLVNYTGYRTDGAQLLNDPDRKIVDKQEWTQTHQVSGKVLFKWLSVEAGYTDSKLGRPGGNQFTTVGNCGRCHYTPNDAEAVQTFNASAQVDVPITEGVGIFGKVYALFKRRSVDLQNDVTRELQTSVGKRRRIGGDVHLGIQRQTFNVMAGGDVKVDDVNSPNIFPELNTSDIRQTVLGAFVDGEYRPHDKVIISAGVRYDHVLIPGEVWRAPTSELSPRGSVVFNALPELSFRGSYGHAFRAPALAELAISQQMYAATLIGNPDLKAERLDAVEVAVDFRPRELGVRLTGTGFLNFARDLINPVYLGGSRSQFQNIGSARVAGFEVEGEGRLPENLGTVTLGYRFIDTYANSTEPLATGRLDYAPAHRISLHAHTRYSSYFFADFYALYLSGRQDAGLLVDELGNYSGHASLPGYLVAGARLGVTPVNHVAASVLVSNLFNTRYEETFGFPAPGIRIFAELKLSY